MLSAKYVRLTGIVVVRRRFLRCLVRSIRTQYCTSRSIALTRKKTFGTSILQRTIKPALCCLITVFFNAIAFESDGARLWRRTAELTWPLRARTQPRSVRPQALPTLSTQISSCRSATLLRMKLPLTTLLRIGQSRGIFSRDLNCWTAAITKKHRKIYERTYPTLLVLPDGSGIDVDYHEPRKIITLPLDLDTLSEAEKKARIERRRPRSKVKIEEYIEDDFDEGRYLKFAKR